MAFIDITQYLNEDNIKLSKKVIINSKMITSIQSEKDNTCMVLIPSRYDDCNVFHMNISVDDFLKIITTHSN